PYSLRVRDQTDVAGFNLMTRRRHEVSATDALTLQAYFDQTERHWQYLNERRHTADLDFQYRTQAFDGHDLILGLGYRFTEDFTRGSFSALLNPANRGTQLYSAFLQDDIQLIKDKLVFIVGSKLEHNDYTGFEGQPNARLLWTPDKNNTLWASVARAVRIPSRADQNTSAINGSLAQYVPTSLPVPVYGRVSGSSVFASESVIAYETGYKQQVSDSFSYDLALFYNQYTRLRSTRQGAASCYPGGGALPNCLSAVSPVQYVYIPLYLLNAASLDTYGAELAVEWKPLDQWRLQGSYTFFKTTNEQSKTGTESTYSTFGIGVNPVHQVSLRSSWNPRPDLDIDLWWRYVDRIGGYFGVVTTQISDYLQMDMRIAWRPINKLELSMTGSNLLDNRHSEFRSELNDVPQVEIRRSIFGQVRWEF
ncbi:MAG: TonB-dependent receptor, partial [Methylococcaceae bacterium]|nr:TonB-dependent receptor [Methylococcaceae bacterium]